MKIEMQTKFDIGDVVVLKSDGMIHEKPTMYLTVLAIKVVFRSQRPVVVYKCRCFSTQEKYLPTKTSYTEMELVGVKFNTGEDVTVNE